MSHPMTNRKWVTLHYSFVKWQSHQSSCIPWHTGSEWHCIVSLPGSNLINHVASYDQQIVSDTASFLCQGACHLSHQSCLIPWPTGGEWHCLFLCHAVSWIMSHPMTNREWVTLLYFFARQSHQSCLISWPTVCEWHQCFISLPGSLINHVSSHDQQDVSDTALFLCQAGS